MSAPSQGRPEVTVRLMNESDVDWVAALSAEHQRDRLTPEQRAAGGFVQGRLSPDRLRAHLSGPAPAWVAEGDGERAGFLMSFHPDQITQGTPHAALQLARQHGLTDVFLYGPAVVAPHARGRGVLRALAETAFAWAAGRYTDAVAFIEDENVVSRRVHARLGFRDVATFTVPGAEDERLVHVVAHGTC